METTYLLSPCYMKVLSGLFVPPILFQFAVVKTASLRICDFSCTDFSTLIKQISQEVICLFVQILSLKLNATIRF
jgi:hypothetical protein